MKRNRIVTLIAGMVLSTTLAVSSPLTAFGTDFFDNAGSGDTETYEDAMYTGADDYSEEDYLEEDYSEDDYSGESDGSGDIEQPAVVYTVTYDLNGHGESYTEDVEEGYSAEGLADTPMDDGYEFLGWFTDKKCQTPWDGMVTSNMTVYAGWEQIPQEPEEPEVIEEPEQTEEPGSSDTEGTEEAAGAAGQEEGAGTVGTDEQAAQADDGNSAPSENTGNAGTTTQEIAEEGDDENASEEAANADERATIIKTPPEAVEVVYSDKAEFKVELKDDVDSSKVTYQWYKDKEKIEGADKDTYVIESVKKDDDGSSYFCECKLNTEEEPYESDPAELTVLDLFKEGNPQNVTAPASGEAKFKVEIVEVQEPSAVKYVWKGTDASGKAVDLKGNKTAETSELVISPAQKYADCEFYCEVTYKDNPPEISESAEVTIQDADGQPQDQTVEYPAGVTFSVPSSDSAKYQWYIHDKSTGKDVKLDGLSATTATLVIPSTTKDDDGQKFFCEITKDGKTEKSEKATLKISNKDQNKPVLYVGNYALDPSKGNSSYTTLDPVECDKDTATLDLSLTDLGSGTIAFNKKSSEIILTNVQFDNATAEYDHMFSPAVGIRLSVEKNSQESYTVRLIGENSITIDDAESNIDEKGSALRFDFKNSKKKAKILIKTTKSDVKNLASLKTLGGKTGIFSEGDINLYTKVEINEQDDLGLTGIECGNLTLGENSQLWIGKMKVKESDGEKGYVIYVDGSCIYVHDEFKMESGANAELYTETTESAIKDAVLYAEKKINIDDKSIITVIAKAGDESIVKSFSGMESKGDINVSGESTVSMVAQKEKEIIPGICTPGTVYGIKAAGAFSLDDAQITIWSKSNDGKGKAYGVLCGSSKISLSKELVYKSQCLASDGIAFAALISNIEEKDQGYQDKYTPKQIKFETAEVVDPHESEINTASIKDGSKYTFVETVYEKGDSTALGTKATTKAATKVATKVVFDANNPHACAWGDIIYEWKKDNSSVTAKQVCKNYEWHVKELEVAKTTKKTIAPTCTEDGKIIYTAVFKNSKYSVKPKEVASGKKALGHKFGEWVIITRPTLTATGEKKHTCERCKKVETAVIPKLTKGTYKVEKGASLSWTKGSGKSLEVKIIRETENKTAFSHFQGILVDGKVLKKDYYKAKSGSVVITFKKDFLSKLAVGTHTLTYGFEDGDNPKSTLVIKSATSNSNSKTSSGTSGKGTTSAKTGDTTNIFLWVLTLCAAGAAVVLIQRYKKNNKKKDQDKDNGSDTTKK